jgi:DNA ligase-1
MVLTPNDLLPSVYMCLNRIAPAYEGKELGIGDMVLMKAISQTTGRSLQVHNLGNDQPFGGQT